MTDYANEFLIFSSNINRAARAFYYHRELQSQVYADGMQTQEAGGLFQDSEIFKAMQANGQFWKDYERTCLEYAIIILGRIFDKNPNSHSIQRLLTLVHSEEVFTIESLRARMIKEPEYTTECVDEYVQSAYGFEATDHATLKMYESDTRSLWEQVKDVRNKLFAHQDVLSHERKNVILENAKYEIFEQIISRLLTIENVFWQAFHNGRRPDYEYINQSILSRVKADTASLLSRLKMQRIEDANSGNH